jgi:putative sigma-54 modulation protein
MPFRVSGKNIDVGEALRGRINDRIAEAMGRYFDGGYSGHVTVAREGFGFRTECAIHLDSKITLHAEGQAADAYASADQAALRVERRLRRYHRRLKEHRSDRLDGRAALEAASYIIAAPEQDSEADLDGFTPVIIAESTTMLKQLSVSDAVMELDMTGAPVLVFPPRRARRHQYRLSARRWAFRLDRSARAGSAGSPLTALWALPMVRRL